MTELHLLRPWWLLGSAICIALALIGRGRAVAPGQWHQVLDPKLATALIRTHSARRTLGAAELLWLMLALGTLALAGPSFTKQLPQDLKDQAAVIVLLGNGNSMYAGDIPPNRNRAAKAKIEALRKAMPQAVFSVIAYASTAHLVIPLTADDGFFELFLQPLEPDIMPTTALTRTGLGQALDLARQSAAQASLPSNVILLTDSLSAQESADLSAFYTVFPAIEVLVVGTEQGGALRFAPTSVSMSAQNGVPMNAFAALKDAGMPVTGISADDQDVNWLLKNIQRTLVSAQNSDAQWHWLDAGYWLVLALLPLALLLHRHLPVRILPLLLLASSFTPEARADWHDLWWTADQQGQQALDRADYTQAAQLFTDPYRKGRAFYLAKDYAQA
ncbi:MAG: vWA domain-containing protein, partial [Pseudomonas sp.]